jgi:hypothetical protein
MALPNCFFVRALAGVLARIHGSLGVARYERGLLYRPGAGLAAKSRLGRNAGQGAGLVDSVFAPLGDSTDSGCCRDDMSDLLYESASQTVAAAEGVLQT